MSSINGLGYRTMIDVAMELAAPSRITVEILNQCSDLIHVMPVVPCNKPEGHLVQVRSQLPTSLMVAEGQPVVPSRAGKQLITYKTGLVKSLQQELVDVAKIGGGDGSDYLLKDSEAFIESLNQKVIDQCVNGNPDSDMNEVKGLAQILNSITGDLATNVVSCGGSGSTNTSIYFLTLGPNGFYMTHPKDGKAGIDVGPVRIDHQGDDTNGYADYFYRYWEWRFGFAVDAWPNLFRACNIDVPTLQAGTSTLDLCKKLRKVPYRLQTKTGRGVWLMNATAMEYLDESVMASMKAGGGISDEKIASGRIMPFFNGYPIIRCDAIGNTEGTVS